MTNVLCLCTQQTVFVLMILRRENIANEPKWKWIGRRHKQNDLSIGYTMIIWNEFVDEFQLCRCKSIVSYVYLCLYKCQLYLTSNFSSLTVSLRDEVSIKFHSLLNSFRCVSITMNGEAWSRRFCMVVYEYQYFQLVQMHRQSYGLYARNLKTIFQI